MLTNVGSGGGVAAPAGAAAASGAPAAEAAKEEAKEEGTLMSQTSLEFPAQSSRNVSMRCANEKRFTEKEESDEDMGFGLFD